VQYAPRRLHWSSIPLDGARALRELAVFVAIVIGLQLFGGRGTSGRLEFLIIALGLFRIVGGVWRYLSTSYQITPESFLFHTGAVFKQNRSIPLGRIQNINVRQGVLHRLFRVAEVRIETATGGGHAEVDLRVVSLAEAEWLRATLLAPVSSAVQAAPASAAGEAPVAPIVNVRADRETTLVYRASLARLLLLGATSNRAMQIVGGAFAVFFFFANEIGDGPNVAPAVRRIVERVPQADLPLLAIAGTAGLILLGWLLSIVLTVVTKYGFELRREPGGRIERVFGLFTRHTSHFPKRRVQMLRVEASVLQRKLGYCRVSVDTAGSFNDEEHGRHMTGTPEVCPIIRRSEADPIIDEVLARPAELSQVVWQRVSRRAIWRAFFRVTVLLMFVIGACGAIDVRVLWGLVAAPVVAIGYALLRYRALGYALSERFLFVRSGIWTRVVRIVPRGKVQASFVTQSPIQRLAGLSTFRVLTAGAGHGAAVPDMEADRAVELQARLHGAESGAQAVADPAIVSTG
jgi:putative membrane protein